LVLLFVDVALILLATLLALLLRENFEISAERLAGLMPYLLATLISALAIFPIAGLNRSVWRFSSLRDHLAVNASIIAVAAAAASLAFIYNRLDGVARSLPVLQYLTGAGLLTGTRVLHRLAHEFRRDRKAVPALLEPVADRDRAKSGLIVGLTRLAEAYLRAAAELTPKLIRIVGIAASKERHTGRLLAAHKVLGRAEDLDEILDTLAVHGVAVDFIAVATAFETLSPEAQQALIAAGEIRNIEIRFLAEDWGLASGDRDQLSPPGDSKKPVCEAAPYFQIPSAQLQINARRRYWAVKRLIDFSGAMVLTILLFPLMLLTALLVAASLGVPVMFWQERPGLGGRTIRLHKFRTMRAGCGDGGRRLSDGERTSWVGNLLRRLRLDELPQLFNILRGDMSFIGPRPLLDHEQSKACSSRLLVRPGLTGWAQVVGGRDIAPLDKAALDVWYVCNANLALDTKIALKTIPFVLFGERVNAQPIDQAWRELDEMGMIEEKVFPAS
jgi:lipopolysaccharide/colanic/teichoic acid biosynthesis glycosyltransferase